MAAAALPAQVMQRWQRLTPAQRVIAALAGAMAIAWAVDAVALRRLRRHVGALRREVEATERQLLAAVAANQHAATVTKAFAAYEPYARRSGSVESELAALLNDLETSVRQSGMMLLNLKPMAARNASEGSVSVAVDAECTPEQLLRLLDQWQRSGRVLKVAELSVRVSEQKTLRASMVVSKLLLK